MVGSVDDLMTSQSIAGHRFQKFAITNEKIAAGEEDHHKPLLKEESQSGGAKGAKGAKFKTEFAVEDRLPL